jgi:hypothetical protein
MYIACLVKNIEITLSHKYILLSEFSVHFGIFWLTWPSSRNKGYVKNTWEDISNVKFRKQDMTFYFYIKDISLSFTNLRLFCVTFLIMVYNFIFEVF